MPESESALRKKCIELSPSSNNTSSKASSAVVVAAAAVASPPNRCSSQNQTKNNNNNNNHSSSNNNINKKNKHKTINNNNNHQIKECKRNGMKNNLYKGSDSSSSKSANFGENIDDDDNDDDDDDGDKFQATNVTTTAAATATTQIQTELASSDGPLNFVESVENCAKSNTIDLDADCDKSNSNLEHAPLIQLSPNKSITLVKQNSTSLIFTKKDVNPVVHRKRITLVRSAGTHSNSEVSTTAATVNSATGSDDDVPIISYTNESIQSSKKRHSYHWQLDTHGQSAADKIKRKQIKSWYAVIGTSSVRESSFDSDAQESLQSSTHEFHSNGLNTTTMAAAAAAATATAVSEEQEIDPHVLAAATGTATPKFNRFELLLKSLNLVGRKASREMPTIASSVSTSAINSSNSNSNSSSSCSSSCNSCCTTQTQQPTSNGSTKTIGRDSLNDINAMRSQQRYSADDSISCASRSDELNQPLLPPSSIQSPEIKISRTPSAHNLTTSLFRNDKCLMSTSSASTTSLNAAVHQRLWSVVPLLRREGSCASLNQQNIKPLIHQQQRSDAGLKKCETVSALTHSQTTASFEPIKARNRLRQSPSVATCSRCSSILSLAANGSRYSLNIANGGFVAIKNNLEKSASIRSDVNKADQISLMRSSITSLNASSSQQIACKLCLADVAMDKMVKIHQCSCLFCIDCMKAYVEFEILEGAYDISCPDAQCSYQGIMDIEQDIATLASHDLLEKHKRFRLNREIELDKNRTWCPRAGCETVCFVEPKAKEKGIAGQSGSLMSLVPVAVKCPTCIEEFCSSCKKAWHPLITCEENTRRLAANGTDDSIGIPFNTDLIKCCPMCGVPIEKDEGCAQMMCKRCKHVFCWYCLASLDDDFLLRHYDKGPCKNKLGHSRASVVWHRAQVIGIFASFGILLLVASPLLLLAAPCIVCCKCRACSTKLDDVDNDFDDPNNGTQSNR